MLKKSIITSRTAETHEPVASHSDHHWLQAPATGLWWWSIPPRYTQPLLFMVWNAGRHTCTKTANTSQRPGALSVCSDVRKTPIQDKPTKGCGSWQHTWPCTERLCCTADGCPNRYLQHLAEPGSRPHMSKIHNNHTKEITSVLFKRLPSHSTESNHDEVLWEVSHEKSKTASPTHSIRSSLHTAQTALRTMQSPPPSTWLLPT